MTGEILRSDCWRKKCSDRPSGKFAGSTGSSRRRAFPGPKTRGKLQPFTAPSWNAADGQCEFQTAGNDMNLPKVLFFVEGNTDIRFVTGLSEICNLTMAVPKIIYNTAGLKQRVESSSASVRVV